MSAQYLWLLVLDSITSPVAWFFFGAGILFTLAVLCFVAWLLYRIPSTSVRHTTGVPK